MTGQEINVHNLGRIRYAEDDDGTMWFLLNDIFKAVGYSSGSSFLPRRPDVQPFVKKFRGEIGGNSTMGANYIRGDAVVNLLSSEGRKAPQLLQ